MLERAAIERQNEARARDAFLTNAGINLHGRRMEEGTPNPGFRFRYGWNGDIPERWQEPIEKN